MNSFILFVGYVYLIAFFVALLVAFLVILIRRFIATSKQKKEEDREAVIAAIAAYISEEPERILLRVKEREYKGKVGFW